MTQSTNEVSFRHQHLYTFYQRARPTNQGNDDLVMENLREHIESFFKEIEFEYLKKQWVEKLIEAGIDKDETGLWAVEIGHVIDEYHSTMVSLADILKETDTNSIPQLIHTWAVGISTVTVSEIDEPMRYLEKQLEKYVPQYDDDDDEPENIK